MRRSSRVLSLLVPSLTLSLLAMRARPAERTTRTTVDSTAHADDQRTWIEMRNVDLRVLENAIVHVSRLHGEVLSTRDGQPALLDSTSSFRIRIASGRVAIDAGDLAALMNQWVFAYKGAPLRDLKVKYVGREIELSGIMHKGVDLHFEQRAEVSLTGDGHVRLHPTRVRILGVDGQALMHALGLRLSNMVNLTGSRGAQVVGDDIYLDAMQMLPPPAIEGRLATIRVENDQLVQEFVKRADDTLFTTRVLPDSTEPNLVYFRGGQLAFGKLTMHDTDLLITDADPKDPLDLYLSKYAAQLIAGTSRTLPNLGLKVAFPDFKDLSAEQKVAAR